MTAASSSAVSSTNIPAATSINSMTIPPSSASLESRIAALELKVGKMTSAEQQPSAQEVSSRLDKLQLQINAHLNSVQIGGMWKESLKLIKELDPDIALTYQQQPLLYKRQQVLAASTLLRNDMQQLDAILKLITTDTQQEATATASSQNLLLRLDKSPRPPLCPARTTRNRLPHKSDSMH